MQETGEKAIPWTVLAVAMAMWTIGAAAMVGTRWLVVHVARPHVLIGSGAVFIGALVLVQLIGVTKKIGPRFLVGTGAAILMTLCCGVALLYGMWWAAALVLIVFVLSIGLSAHLERRHVASKDCHL